MLRDASDGKTFFVAEQFDFRINYTDFVRVETNFRTDLASIPRVAQIIVPKLGRFNQSACTHDWCYKNRFVFVKSHFYDHTGVERKSISRKDADQIFLQAMKVAGVRYTRRMAIYWAVRAGGWTHWNKCTNCL